MESLSGRLLTVALVGVAVLLVSGCGGDNIERFTNRLPPSFPTSVSFPGDSEIVESEKWVEGDSIHYRVRVEIGSDGDAARRFFEDALASGEWRICASLEGDRGFLISFSEMACTDPPNSVTIEPIDEVRSLAIVEIAVGE
jgi:hypothetical protein